MSRHDGKGVMWRKRRWGPFQPSKSGGERQFHLLWWRARWLMPPDKRLSTPRHPENQRVGDLAVMQIKKVGRAVVGFKRGQVLRTEMRIRLLARKDRKQKGQVGIVCVQQIQLAEVQRVIARNGGEISVELVVGFRKQIAIRVGEDAGKLSHLLIEFRFCRTG